MLTLLVIVLGIAGVALLLQAPLAGVVLLVLAYGCSRAAGARDEERFLAWLMVLGGLGVIATVVDGLWPRLLVTALP